MGMEDDPFLLQTFLLILSHIYVLSNVELTFRAIRLDDVVE